MSRGGYRKGAGRKANWRQGETKTIRVPVILEDQILDLAQKLDRGKCVGDCRYSKLNHLLNSWETKCDLENANTSEWQKVRELIGEIRAVLSSTNSARKEEKNQLCPKRQGFCQQSKLSSDSCYLEKFEEERDLI